MKHKILGWVLGFAAFGIIATGCDSPQQNVVDAKENLQDAKDKLRESNKDSLEQAEWQEFKTNSQASIADNNAAITKQKELKSKKGTTLDPIYEANIESLQAKNAALQKRMDDYEKYHSDWATFKREFNHDLEELGKTIKDISKDNAK